jgi:hypothetical protein
MAYTRERYNRRTIPPRTPITREYLDQELQNVQRGIPWPVGADLRDFTPAANGKKDDSAVLAKADAAVNGNGLLMIPRGRYYVGSDISFSSAVHFEPGAVLVIPTGVTVHINNGLWSTPGHQTFETSGTGQVMFGSAANQWADAPSIVSPDNWGAPGNTTPYDDAAVQAAFNSQAYVVFLRHYYIVATVDLSITEACVDFRKFQLIGVSGTPNTDSCLHIRCNYSRVYNLAVNLQNNTNYKCAVRWYGDAQHVYPGRNDFFGFKIEQAINGLVVGAHRGDVPEDRPVSENAIYGFQSNGCQIPLYGNQPNGKLQFIGGTFAVDKGNWSGDGETTGVFRYEDGVAVWNEPSSGGGTVGGAEFNFIGCNILVNQVGATKRPKPIRGANMKFDGGLFEGYGGSLIEGDRVSITGNQNTLCGSLGFEPAFTIAAGATGSLKLTRVFAEKSQDPVAGISFIDGSLAPDFVAVLDNCDLTGWRWSHTGEYAPLVKGCQVQFIGRSRIRTWGGGADFYVGGDDSRSLLTTADSTGASFGAAVDQTAKGGWTHSTGGGVNNKFGKSATAAPGYATSIYLLSDGVGVSSIITTPTGTNANRVFPNKTVLARAWVRPEVGGGTFIVRFSWYKFDGSASATATTDLLSATNAELGWTLNEWIPITLYAVAPNDAEFFAVSLLMLDGAEILVDGLRFE